MGTALALKAASMLAADIEILSDDVTTSIFVDPSDINSTYGSTITLDVVYIGAPGRRSDTFSRVVIEAAGPVVVFTVLGTLGDTLAVRYADLDEIEDVSRTVAAIVSRWFL